MESIKVLDMHVIQLCLESLEFDISELFSGHLKFQITLLIMKHSASDMCIMVMKLCIILQFGGTDLCGGILMFPTS